MPHRCLHAFWAYCEGQVLQGEVFREWKRVITGPHYPQFQNLHTSKKQTSLAHLVANLFPHVYTWPFSLPRSVPASAAEQAPEQELTGLGPHHRTLVYLSEPYKFLNSETLGAYSFRDTLWICMYCIFTTAMGLENSWGRFLTLRPRGTFFFFFDLSKTHRKHFLSFPFPFLPPSFCFCEPRKSSGLSRENGNACFSPRQLPSQARSEGSRSWRLGSCLGGLSRPATPWGRPQTEGSARGPPEARPAWAGR